MSLLVPQCFKASPLLNITPHTHLPLLSRQQTDPLAFTSSPWLSPRLTKSIDMHRTQFYPLVGPQCPLQQLHLV